MKSALWIKTEAEPMSTPTSRSNNIVTGQTGYTKSQRDNSQYAIQSVVSNTNQAEVSAGLMTTYQPLRNVKVAIWDGIIGYSHD